MRTSRLLVLPAVATLALLAGGPEAVLHGPATASAATPDACKERLDPDRRTAYRFRSGRATLPFGQVVVTATAADRHRYCIQVRFGGRTVFNRFGLSSYKRQNGRWVNEGGLGDAGGRGKAYDQTMQVPDRTRIDRSYGVRWQGRWYDTISISRFNL